MGNISWEAYHITSNWLIIITIVLTLLLNVALLYKIVRAAGGIIAVVAGPRGPRFQTLVSLTIGDTLVALFSLVVIAKMTWFDLYLFDSMSCRIFALACSYLAYVMPFVYGVGLLVLTLERSIFRRRAQTASPPPQSSRVVVSLAVSSVPWLLAILTVVPLITVDIDFDLCPTISLWLFFSKERTISLICICLLLPSVLAAVTTVKSVCTTQGPYSYTLSRRAVCGDQQAATVAFRSLPGEKLEFTGVTCESSTEATLIQTKPPPSYPEACILPEANTSIEPEETRAHVIVQLVYFGCVFPSAIHLLCDLYLTEALGEWNMETNTSLVVIKGLVYWLFIFRTFLVPSVWLMSGSFTTKRATE